jgi:hypothetical protein
MIGNKDAMCRFQLKGIYLWKYVAPLGIAMLGRGP